MKIDKLALGREFGIVRDEYIAIICDNIYEAIWLFNLFPFEYKNKKIWLEDKWTGRHSKQGFTFADEYNSYSSHEYYENSSYKTITFKDFLKKFTYED